MEPLPLGERTGDSVGYLWRKYTSTFLPWQGSGAVWWGSDPSPHGRLHGLAGGHIAALLCCPTASLYTGVEGSW